MVDLDAIVSSKFIAPPRRPGVYLLFDGNEIVYVGMARFNLRGRFAQHFGDSYKEFTHFGYIELPTEQVREVENELIRRYLPRYNKALPKGLSRQLREAEYGTRTHD